MSFPSMQSHGDAVRSLTLLAVIAASLVIGAPQPARGGQPEPSPFAGCYVLMNRDGSAIPIAIDASGGISGPDSHLIRVSGSIADSGAMRLTIAQRIINFGSAGGGVLRDRYSGFGALDEFGNLYGILEDQYAGFWSFYWPRCD